MGIFLKNLAFFSELSAILVCSRQKENHYLFFERNIFSKILPIFKPIALLFYRKMNGSKVENFLKNLAFFTELSAILVCSIHKEEKYLVFGRNIFSKILPIF